MYTNMFDAAVSALFFSLKRTYKSATTLCINDNESIAVIVLKLVVRLHSKRHVS
jgi:hypothetical protein